MPGYQGIFNGVPVCLRTIEGSKPTLPVRPWAFREEIANAPRRGFGSPATVDGAGFGFLRRCSSNWASDEPCSRPRPPLNMAKAMPHQVSSVPAIAPESSLGHFRLSAKKASAQVRICSSDNGGGGLPRPTPRRSFSNLGNEVPPGRPRNPARKQQSICFQLSVVSGILPE